MFTLKLYRKNGAETDRKTHLVIPAHHVVVHEIGPCALELMVFSSAREWDTYYVGSPSEGMEAFGRQDLHLGLDPGSWWGWGLLENWEGNTSEHYRPASYG